MKYKHFWICSTNWYSVTAELILITTGIFTFLSKKKKVGNSTTFGLKSKLKKRTCLCCCDNQDLGTSLYFCFCTSTCPKHYHNSLLCTGFPKDSTTPAINLLSSTNRRGIKERDRDIKKMLSSLNFLSEVLIAHSYVVLMIKSCKCNICKKSGERNLSQDINIRHIRKSY